MVLFRNQDRWIWRPLRNLSRRFFMHLGMQDRDEDEDDEDDVRIEMHRIQGLLEPFDLDFQDAFVEPPAATLAHRANFAALQRTPGLDNPCYGHPNFHFRDRGALYEPSQGSFVALDQRGAAVDQGEAAVAQYSELAPSEAATAETFVLDVEEDSPDEEGDLADQGGAAEAHLSELAPLEAAGAETCVVDLGDEEEEEEQWADALEQPPEEIVVPVNPFDLLGQDLEDDVFHDAPIRQGKIWQIPKKYFFKRMN